MKPVDEEENRGSEKEVGGMRGEGKSFFLFGVPRGVWFNRGVKKHRRCVAVAAGRGRKRLQCHLRKQEK